VCAIRAAQLGLRTAVVDKEWLGGVFLNVGCILSKSLLKNAGVAEILRHRSKDFGFSFDNLKLDFGADVKRTRQVSDRLTNCPESRSLPTERSDTYQLGTGARIIT
jgi:dihydrolipoamide dehydrogenase